MVRLVVVQEDRKLVLKVGHASRLAYLPKLAAAVRDRHLLAHQACPPLKGRHLPQPPQSNTPSKPPSGKSTPTTRPSRPKR